MEAIPEYVVSEPIETLRYESGARVRGTVWKVYRERSGSVRQILRYASQEAAQAAAAALNSLASREA